FAPGPSCGHASFDPHRCARHAGNPTKLLRPSLEAGRSLERAREIRSRERIYFSGDPMRLDYSYRRNGTRGYVRTLSVSRAPNDCKSYAYTAARIAARAP